MFRSTGPATNVPVVLSIAVDTAKNSGVIKVSAMADFTGLDVSPLDFRFLFHANETADGDLDSACGSFHATLKNRGSFEWVRTATSLEYLSELGTDGG